MLRLHSFTLKNAWLAGACKGKPENLGAAINGTLATAGFDHCVWFMVPSGVCVVPVSNDAFAAILARRAEMLQAPDQPGRMH